MVRQKNQSRQLSGKRAQRSGDDFEQEVELANAHYLKMGIGAIDKIPTGAKPVRQRTGEVAFKPMEKTGCDFMGVYQGRPIALETKSTSQTAFPLYSNGNKPMVKPHQLFFLDAYQRAGGEAYILVRVGPKKRVFRLTASTYQDLAKLAEESGKKSIPISWLEDAAQEIERGHGNILDYLGKGLGQT